jgi:hypothetical protein
MATLDCQIRHVSTPVLVYACTQPPAWGSRRLLACMHENIITSHYRTRATNKRSIRSACMRAISLYRTTLTPVGFPRLLLCGKRFKPCRGCLISLFLRCCVPKQTSRRQRNWSKSSCLFTGAMVPACRCMITFYFSHWEGSHILSATDCYHTSNGTCLETTTRRISKTLESTAFLGAQVNFRLCLLTNNNVVSTWKDI